MTFLNTRCFQSLAKCPICAMFVTCKGFCHVAAMLVIYDKSWSSLSAGYPCHLVDEMHDCKNEKRTALLNMGWRFQIMRKNHLIYQIKLLFCIFHLTKANQTILFLLIHEKNAVTHENWMWIFGPILDQTYWYESNFSCSRNSLHQ